MKEKNLNKIFNLNTVISVVISWAAYIILVASIGILFYLSFIKAFNIEIDWVTLTIFSVAVVSLSWLNWTNFYKRQYEKSMEDDIDQHSEGKYSIHARYYFAVKDYSDIELQKQIDKFNDEYTEKWLRWVEKYTGHKIESHYEVELDEDGQPKLDENGKPIKYLVKGILDLPYKGFKHKFLMWRIKTHHYPQSGYKTSMEVMSLFAFQDANLNKRKLKADKSFYLRKAITKLITSTFAIVATASVIPEMIAGEYWSAILKLLIGLFALLSSVIMGALNGARGAQLKLSTVEEVCADLERWHNTKPVFEPYSEPKEVQQQLLIPEVQELPTTQDTNIPQPITHDIFNVPKMQNK